jgi:hypothetical protein
MVVDELAKNSTSLTIDWGIKAPNVTLEFLPSISEVPPDKNMPPVWKNNTKWINTTRFQFTDLNPHNEYNMTVYVRQKNSTKVFQPALYVVAMTSEAC